VFQHWHGLLDIFNSSSVEDQYPLK
jgi:hypothetical protein